MSATSAVFLSPAVPMEVRAYRKFGKLVLRVVVYCLLFSIIFVPEFPRSATPNLLYEKAALGFRVVDLLVISTAIAHLIFIGCLRGVRFGLPRTLALPGVAFLACIAVAAIHGALRGGSNFFFDWRGLALGMALYVVWSFWLQSSEEVAFAVRCLAAYVAVRLVVLYALYAAGYRDTLFGASIPLFDGPILSAIVFATLLAVSGLQHAGRVSKVMSMGLAVGGGSMVLLCMRRTYWVELGLGVFFVLLLQPRRRVRHVAAFIAVIVVVGATLGPTFLNRLESLDLTRSDTPYSADNADHLNDLYDAWYQVQRSPIFGIGLGTSYETWHIRNWKSESVMVHNAPLHVWLKYGVAGLLCYLWFHVALLRWLGRQTRVADCRHRAFVVSVFAYLCAQFIVTLGFAPWPYSELQLTLLASFLLAAVVALSRSQSHQHAWPSPVCR